MTDVSKQLNDEIERVKGEIDAQKKLIKKNTGKTLMVETAEAEMKALHTRLSVLEANLAKHRN
jgi:CHASE3 domain sensor protein